MLTCSQRHLRSPVSSWVVVVVTVSLVAVMVGVGLVVFADVAVVAVVGVVDVVLFFVLVLVVVLAVAAVVLQAATTRAWRLRLRFPTRTQSSARLSVVGIVSSRNTIVACCGYCIGFLSVAAPRRIHRCTAGKGKPGTCSFHPHTVFVSLLVTVFRTRSTWGTDKRDNAICLHPAP